MRLPPHLFMAIAAACLPLAAPAGQSAPVALIQAEELRPESVPDDTTLEANGARIGTIQIDAADVFESDRDPTAGTLARLADRMHWKTREATIRAQLLFYSGARYSRTALRETERLLRRSVYLTDVSVHPVAWHDGVVDVRVRTRDVWTLNIGASFGRSGGENSSGFGLEDLNLFGTGTRLSVGYRSTVDRSSKVFRYGDDGLFDSRWRLETRLADNSDGYERGLLLEQPFYSLETRRAGGLRAQQARRIDPLYSAGRIASSFDTSERLLEAWYGRSEGLQAGWARRYSIGFRDEQRSFASRGDLTTLPLPPDLRLSYPWVGVEWLQDSFATTRNRETISRTEDIQLGWHVTARLGAATRTLGSSFDAAMVEVAASKGLLIGERQMLELQGSLGGRAGASRTNAIASGAARYFFRSGPSSLSFLGLSVDVGHRVDADRQLTLGGDNGLRGYPLRYAAGSGRWLFTAEQRWFSSWYPLRMFNVGAAAFVDAGAAFGSAPGADPRTQRVLADAGIGLRLANSRSARANVLHIDIAYPFQAVVGQRSGPQLLIETRTRF